MGVSEMTRFGMEEKDFKILAGLMADLIQKGSAVKDDIIKFRNNFIDMRYCFNEADVQDMVSTFSDAFK